MLLSCPCSPLFALLLLVTSCCLYAAGAQGSNSATVDGAGVITAGTGPQANDHRDDHGDDILQQGDLKDHAEQNGRKLQSTCPETIKIQEPTRLVLSTNYVAAEDLSCVMFELFAGAELDCAGYSIKGSSATTAIQISASNATVKNCVFENLNYAVRGEFNSNTQQEVGDSITFENNRFLDNVGCGLSFSAGNIIDQPIYINVTQMFYSESQSNHYIISTSGHIKLSVERSSFLSSNSLESANGMIVSAGNTVALTAPAVEVKDSTFSGFNVAILDEGISQINVVDCAFENIQIAVLAVNFDGRELLLDQGITLESNTFSGVPTIFSSTVSFTGSNAAAFLKVKVKGISYSWTSTTTPATALDVAGLSVKLSVKNSTFTSASTQGNGILFGKSITPDSNNAAALEVKDSTFSGFFNGIYALNIPELRVENCVFENQQQTGVRADFRGDEVISAGLEWTL